VSAPDRSAEASSAEIAAAVRANYKTQRDAMVAGDADALGALLAPGFTLTHMTGYRQPGAGAMAYHVIEDVEVVVHVDDTAPVLTVRSRTEATIWGTHGRWPLRLRIRFTRVGGSWLASDTVASTWT
jgi:hypothetical protein